MSSPVAVGLVGCGAYGRQVQLAHLLTLRSFKVAALANRSEGPLLEAQRQCLAAGAEPKLYRDWRELVRDPGVKAVVATLPPQMNVAVVEACDAAGKAVLIEKPAAADTQDLMALDHTARRRRIHIQVGTQLLFGRWFGTFEQAVATLGEPLSVSSQVYGPDRWAMQPMTWKVDAQTSGGVLNSWGVHPLTMLLKASAAPGAAGFSADYAELCAFTGSAFDRDGVDPAMYDTLSCAWMTLGPGDHATPCQLELALHPDAVPSWTMQAVCTGGRVVADFYAGTVTLHRRGAPAHAAEVINTNGYAGPGWDGNPQALEHFAQCVRAGRIDLGTLDLAITASRFALEVNVNPTLDDEGNDDSDDFAPPKRDRRDDGGAQPGQSGKPSGKGQNPGNVPPPPGGGQGEGKRKRRQRRR